MAKQNCILIVDDTDEMRDVLIEIVRMQGHFAIGANNAASAIETLKSLTFQVVITDIEMPGMNGIDLARYIKATYPETAVIIITGNRDPETAEIIADMGLQCFYKPLTISTLIKTVENELKKSDD
jgi:DNA-binding NtrC family response regulator